MRKKVVHRRYSDKRGRADLKALALCNNINGPLPGPKPTGDPKKVTCGRCLRIMYPSWKNPPRRPFSDGALRRMSRELAPPAPPKLSIEVVDGVTDEVVKTLGPFASARLRDKADAGLTRQLDHQRFFTRFA